MIRQAIYIRCDNGLHIRPSGELVTAAVPLKSSVKIIKDDKQVNLKSVLGILSLCIRKGDTIFLEVEGTSEDEDFKIIKNTFIERRIGILV